MKLKKYIVVIFYALSSTAVISAQYKEPEKKDKIEALYPQVPFDSLQAKQKLAKGTAYDTNQVNIGSSKPEKFVNKIFDLQPWANRPLHIVLSVNGDRMAVYLNDVKLADEVLFSPTVAKNFYISAPWRYSNDSAVLVSNFKVSGFKQ
ncbi:hypothetical protein J2799_001705 [Chryseobacterium vietnamense]|uniref:hypothetical protein n=1 Tax=Chryseobacterium vietnamense TaxID=866785 RepID=UPI00286053D8|nr:hypothetical protein [Chryseobacterium vietnamense]MDR6487220.1 hypothetical protein [Chryseobacterium vietnamense]